MATRATSSVRGNCSTMALSSACRSVSELESAAELDQGLAVVVAMAVEGAIHPALNAALERIEDRRRDQNGQHQRPLAHRLRHRVVDQDGDERDDAEVAADNQRRGQRIRHAALEDQVRVHQPVADDGPG